MEMLSLLSELEENERANLLSFVDTELNREYLPKHRNKSAKMPADAGQDFRLSGERMSASIREGGKAFRVDMTFPLFDLEDDYTLVVCSCQRDVLSLETHRCHHMHFFQDQVRKALQKLKAQAPEDPLAGLQILLGEREAAADEDVWLKEFRWRWVFDPQRFSLHFERQGRDRYDPGAEWKWQETLNLEQWCAANPARARAIPRDQQVYDLIAEARLSGQALTDGRRTILVEEGSWSLAIQVLDTGLEVKPAFPEPHLRVEGRGLLAWYEATATLLTIPLQAKEEQFLAYLQRMDKPFPLAHKERVLDLLAQMDQKVFRYSQEEEGALQAADYRSVVRLTPFKKGGMRVEIKLQIEAGLCLTAGEGERTLVRLSGKGRWERDFGRERRLTEQLIDRLGLAALPQPEAGVWIAFNDAKALECVARIEEHKGQVDFLVEWPSFLAKKPYEMAAPLAVQSLKVSVGDKKDWLAVEGWLELDDGQKLSLKEVLKTIRRRNNYLQLPDGRWSLIPEHFKGRLEPLSEAVEFDEGEGEGKRSGEGMTLDLAALDDEARLAAIAVFPFQESSKSFWSLVARARRGQQLPIALPKGLLVELRPYQQDGYRWLSRLAEWGLGACLADDMGLGKTLQTLAVLLARKERGPSLVIAPSSLSYNWQSEALKFTPELRIIQMRELAGRGVGMNFAPGDIVVASYGLILRHAENLAAISWNILVLDEAQLIKNAQTKTAQAVQTLKADWTVALSGTPIENHLGDLWSLFRTISPGLFGEWERFKRSYVFPIEREDSAAAKQRLKGKIAPFVLRRMKKDYLTELPAKTEVDLWIDLSQEEQEAYDAMRGEAIEKVSALVAEDPEAQTQMQILAALTRLRQAACHRSLVDESWTGSSSKVEALKERLAELKEAGHAALVFSQFTRFLKIIHQELAELGLKVLYLDGSTPVKERLRLVELFQAGGYDVFLISLKAGGTGLNLTRASYVFHLDPWWNPAIESQASDRAYRMGQKQAVTVYRLRSRATIEEMIHAMHGEKRELVESVLEGRKSEDAVKWKELWSALWPEAAYWKKPSSQEKGLF